MPFTGKYHSLDVLRQLCREKGLSDDGKRANLIQRLKQDEENRSLLSPNSQGMESEADSESCDAILVTRSEVGGEEDMKRDAKRAPEQALEEETLSVEELGGELFVGNRRGLNFADRLSVLERQVGRIPSLEATIASHGTEIASHETDIDTNKQRISSLLF